jgi:hypothetical protein
VHLQPPVGDEINTVGCIEGTDLQVQFMASCALAIAAFWSAVMSSVLD